MRWRVGRSGAYPGHTGEQRIVHTLTRIQFQAGTKNGAASLRFLQGRGVSLSSHSGLSPSHVLGQRWVHKDSCTFFGIQVSFKFPCLC